jgi:hypothetical protein
MPFLLRRVVSSGLCMPNRNGSKAFATHFGGTFGTDLGFTLPAPWL